MNKQIPLEMGKRERQVAEAVIKLGEASVAEVQQQLANPPSYSAVRATLSLLVQKKWLKYRRDGKKYLYRPANSVQKNQRTALGRLVDTFFGGSPSEAISALLDSSATDLSDEELLNMMKKIKQARRDLK